MEPLIWTPFFCPFWAVLSMESVLESLRDLIWTNTWHGWNVWFRDTIFALELWVICTSKAEHIPVPISVFKSPRGRTKAGWPSHHLGGQFYLHFPINLGHACRSLLCPYQDQLDHFTKVQSAEEMQDGSWEYANSQNMFSCTCALAMWWISLWKCQEDAFCIFNAAAVHQLQWLQMCVLPLQPEHPFRPSKDTEERLKVIPKFCFPDPKDWFPSSDLKR